jgi:hypothetical protein
MPENFSLADIADRSALQKAIDQNECPALYRLVIDVATASPHREFAEALCIELASHDDELVRGNAILGFGHLARIHGRLDSPKIQQIIECALTDPSLHVSGHAHSAMDDVRHFLGWEF